MKIVLSGDTLDPAEAAARDVRAELGVSAPERVVRQDESAKRDPATAFAIASLILSIPGAVLTTLQIRDHLDRRRLSAKVAHLQAELARTDTEAGLTLDGRAPVDLRRMSTDAAVDLLIADLSRGAGR